MCDVAGHSAACPRAHMMGGYGDAKDADALTAKARQQAQQRDMTVEQVREGVERVRAVAADDEQAHMSRDGIWLSVLRAIAEGMDDPQALARAALATEDIEFSRWYA